MVIILRPITEDRAELEKECWKEQDKEIQSWNKIWLICLKLMLVTNHWDS